MGSTSSILDTTSIAILSALTGISSHVVFHAREPQVVPLLAVLSTSLLGLFVYCQLVARTIMESCVLTSVALASFATCLYTSMILYRVFLSPLRNVPGPPLAAVSKFWYLHHSVKGSMSRVIQKLHLQYGDIVRIGPNELSIVSLDAVDLVLGAKGKMNKGPWYDAVNASTESTSLHGIKAASLNAQRRKYWNKAMTSSATKEYLVFIKDCVGRLCDRLHSESREQSSVQDIRRVMNHLSFDITGEIGFARSFGMIENGKDHSFVLFVENAMHAIAIFAEIPWILPVLKLLPLGKYQDEINSLSMDTTLKRFGQGHYRPDLISHFLREEGQPPSDMTIKDLDADVRLMIIAGSDTTASALTFVFEYLSQHPRWMKRLRDEVDASHHGQGNFSLDQMPVLDAIVNETLRLRPPVPARSQRVVPVGGVILCGQFIPAGTLVGIPPSLMMRDKRYFSPSPDVWRPEQWLNPDEEESFCRSAFIPFSYGNFSCVGKNLGLLMVRYSVARFMLEFEITAAPEHDPIEFEKSIKEYFTAQKGPFLAVMIPRVSERK